MKNKLFYIFAGLVFSMFFSCKTTNQLEKYEGEPQILSEFKTPDRFVYKHVVIVGIDGAGSFQKKCNTPNMDSIFADGIWTPKCQASRPTISAQCWGSMLIGVKPSVHKLNNDKVSSGEGYSNELFPTIFSLARMTNPESKLAAFCNWTPIYEGIIERNIGVYTDSGDDDEVSQKAAAYIKSEKPDLLFIQFDSVDHAGHHSGYGKPDYLKALETVDTYVARIYDAVKEAGIDEDTLFILTADHGGHFNWHGSNSKSETQLYFGAKGKTVNHSTNLVLNGRDLAAIVCHAMNLKKNQLWDSKVPEGFFSE